MPDIVTDQQLPRNGKGRGQPEGWRVISENEEVCLARKGVVSEEGDFNEEGAWSERMELR